MASEVPGFSFYDGGSGKQLKYVYPDTKHWTAGWLLYKHPDGQWVTYRKATDADIVAMNKAIVEAHHVEQMFNVKSKALIGRTEQLNKDAEIAQLAREYAAARLRFESEQYSAAIYRELLCADDALIAAVEKEGK
jgi:hypothetical protein